jgi:hypothetical protein
MARASVGRASEHTGKQLGCAGLIEREPCERGSSEHGPSELEPSERGPSERGPSEVWAERWRAQRDSDATAQIRLWNRALRRWESARSVVALPEGRLLGACTAVGCEQVCWDGRTAVGRTRAPRGALCNVYE